MTKPIYVHNCDTFKFIICMVKIKSKMTIHIYWVNIIEKDVINRKRLAN